MKTTITTLLLCWAIFPQCGTAQSNDFAIREVKAGLYIPWDMIEAPDGQIWFTQKDGSISRMNPVTGIMKTIFHQPATNNQGEGGMLGLALHPQFPDSSYAYVVYNYLNASSQNKEKVVRMLYQNDTLTEVKTIVENIAASSIHNGSRLLMHQNYLYITTGDAANPSSAQNINSLNGKVLRYTLMGEVPNDNPLINSPIWSWGHRNSQGLCMMGNVMVGSEHGSNSDDEINIIYKKRNYGWPTVQGFCNTAAEIQFCNDSIVAEPAKAWTPTLAVCGIAFYDQSLFPQWTNKLLMTTLKDNKFYVHTFNADRDSILQSTVISQVNYGRLRDVLVAANGKIYISTSNSGSVNNRVDKILEIYDPTPSDIKEKRGKYGWQISPNPGSGWLQVENISGIKKAVTLQLFSIYGQWLRTLQCTQGKNIFDMSQLPVGTYLLCIEDETKQMLKWVKSE